MKSLVAFWDTSALVPLVVEERRSTWAQALWQSQFPCRFVWWASLVECSSAIARLEREGKLDEAEVDAALLNVTRVSAAWNEVQPTETVRAKARRLLRLHSLRTADAFQLAAALVASEDLAFPIGFVCLDDRLATAAKKEGFMVLSSEG